MNPNGLGTCEATASPIWSFWDSNEHIYLQPGLQVVRVDPTILTAVVGSCVAVCLWDRDLAVGGMSHYVLPYWRGSRGSSSGRYGNVGIETLIERMVELGSRPPNLRAKIFGGASPAGPPAWARKQLGIRNAELAFDVLAAHSIPVDGSAVGGHRGRKVHFQTDSGSSWVKAI